MKSLFTSSRRVRIVQYALFGAFIFHFTAVLHAEDLLVVGLRLCPTLTSEHLLAHPQYLGAATTALLLPLFVWSNERWQWLSRIGSTLQQFTAMFMAFFLFGISIPANEQQTLERQTARLLALGMEEKAFEVGKSYLFTTARLQVLRQQALVNDDKLGNLLFQQPVHYYNKAQRQAALQQLSVPVVQGGLNYRATTATIPSEAPHVAALLDGDLSRFAQTLPKRYTQTLPSAQVPLYYRQALLLYMRLNTHPQLNFSDDATEANYKDFVEQQRKLRLQYPPSAHQTFSTAEKNKMNFFFGNTYWYYYFYEVPKP